MRYYWAALHEARPVINSVFCAEKRTPGGGKTQGLVPRSDVLTSGFIRFSFAPTLARIYIFYLALAPPEKPEGVASQEGYLRCLKRFDDRSHFRSFVTVRV